MIKSFLVSVFLLIPLLGFSQTNDSLARPLFSQDNKSFLRDIDFTFDMRVEFRAYKFRGGDQYYNGMQFQNGFTALGIAGKLHENVSFRFRHRFNKGGEVQSLDLLGNNIEIAYLDVKLGELLNLRLGKMNPFYGGYEYEFSPMYVLEYNEIYGNALAFVTGAGITYQALKDHQFGLQVLNSRTMLYQDLYGDVIAENIQEPIWPVSVVGNWRGSFFDGKFQTIYSLSYGNEVKNRGTYFFTLGHKYEQDKFSLMYDFHYSYEQVDTKGVVTNLRNDESVAEDVMYAENWLRAEYSFSPEFQGLLTLMTSSAYDKIENKSEHLGTSYGMIPTIYYSPFKNIDLRFFFAYIGRFYEYSSYGKENLGLANYNRNELRIGVMAPLLLF
ncbi:MAG TPA: porin [Salegentibacter sp.]|uniref:porin n=1 Tax=Salegentibacter sp. TaxID=1903072 RepID=UPI002F95B067